MKRRVVILGSTGSVGTNTLDVIRQRPDEFEVVGLSCGKSVASLAAQIQEFGPTWVSVGDGQAAEDLQTQLESLPKSPREIFVSDDGHAELIRRAKPDIVMASMLGTFGLKACLEAIRQGVFVLGLANKEVLVMAGTFIKAELKRSKTKIVPVDSEHSAIFQALMGNRLSEVNKVILTASGGPFLNLPASDFINITKQQALRHPNWVMGEKITIDSATLMNKGLEYIEAIQLFDLRPSQLEILVHPQSVIHSLVEYHDHSSMAQLGVSDMRIPISLALSWPRRLPLLLNRSLQLSEIGSLTFLKPDYDRFPCLRLAQESVEMGAHGTVILNAANEVVVHAFLQEEIGFLDIPRNIELAMNEFKSERVSTLDEVLDLDHRVKNWTARLLPAKLEGRRAAVAGN